MTQFRILIGEDNRDEALELIRIIRGIGYDLTGVVKTGEEAVRIATEKDPDIIIMDIHLPGIMDGISAAEYISSENAIPVVFLTGHSDLKRLRRTTSTRLAGFVTKPYSEKDIARALEMAIFKSESEKIVQENRQWLKTVLDCIGEGIIATNTNEEIRHINPAACDIIGISYNCEGLFLSEVLRIFRSSDDAPVFLPLQIQKRMHLSEIDYPLYIQHPAGHKIYIDGVLSPLEEPEHGYAGVVINIRDISESVVVKKVLHDAYKQIEINLEKFALLNDQIRNPLSVIIAILDLYESEHLEEILPYVKEIDEIIDQLDNGYIESSKIRNILKKHHEID